MITIIILQVGSNSWGCLEVAVATAPAGGVDLGPVIAEEPSGRGLDGMLFPWYFHGFPMVSHRFPMGL